MNLVNGRRHPVASLLSVIVLTFVSSSSLHSQTTTRVSVDSQGIEGNANSDFPAMSSDGRVIAFMSFSSNLVGNDTNGTWDVFVRDRGIGEVARVSVDSQGRQGSNSSRFPSISANGQFVVFESLAPDLVADDTNGNMDIFVHDRQTGATARVSVDSHGTQGNGTSEYASISPDGRFIVFRSIASNLVLDDANGVTDVFIHDRQTALTIRVSIDSAGNQGNADSGSLWSAVSSDGRFVTFGSGASNLVPGDDDGHWDVFVHDCQTGETIAASVDSQGRLGNGYSDSPSMSSDGRFVTFHSAAALVSEDRNGFEDIYVHDCSTGETTRLSVDSQGKEANGRSYFPRFSAGGRFLSFESWADNLVSGDTNQTKDVFLVDRQVGLAVRVSLDSQGDQGNSESWASCVSNDGQLVAFTSFASNLVPGDANGSDDVFVRDTAACTVPASWTNYGSGWPGSNGTPDLIAMSNPVLCNTISLVADNSYGTFTVGVLFIGLSDAYLPTAWGGTLLVLPLLVSPVFVPGAGLSLNAIIPCDISMCGLEVFLQVLEVDQGASRGISFTPGLKLILGGS